MKLRVMDLDQFYTSCIGDYPTTSLTTTATFFDAAAVHISFICKYSNLIVTSAIRLWKIKVNVHDTFQIQGNRN